MSITDDILTQVTIAVMTYIVENGEVVGDNYGLSLSDGLTVEDYRFDERKKVFFDYYDDGRETVVCEVEVTGNYRQRATFRVEKTFAEILADLANVRGIRL